MKKFSDIKKVKRINEAVGESNLPSNYEDMSKEKLLSLMSGKKEQPEPENKEEENKEVSSEGGDVSKFISKLLESREMAQVYHWTVKGDMGSHAAHLALEAYYDGVIGFIDELVEVYSGEYEIIENYDIIDASNSKTKERLEYFTEIANYIKSERSCFSKEDSHLHNTVDEILSLVYRTIYKLKFSK